MIRPRGRLSRCGLEAFSLLAVQPLRPPPPEVPSQELAESLVVGRKKPRKGFVDRGRNLPRIRSCISRAEIPGPEEWIDAEKRKHFFKDPFGLGKEVFAFEYQEPAFLEMPEVPPQLIFVKPPMLVGEEPVVLAVEIRLFFHLREAGKYSPLLLLEGLIKGQGLPPPLHFMEVVGNGAVHGISQQNNELGMGNDPGNPLRSAGVAEIEGGGLPGHGSAREPATEGKVSPVPTKPFGVVPIKKVDFFSLGPDYLGVLDQALVKAGSPGFCGSDDEKVGKAPIIGPQPPELQSGLFEGSFDFSKKHPPSVDPFSTYHLERTAPAFPTGNRL